MTEPIINTNCLSFRQLAKKLKPQMKVPSVFRSPSRAKPFSLNREGRLEGEGKVSSIFRTLSKHKGSVSPTRPFTPIQKEEVYERPSSASTTLELALDEIRALKEENEQLKQSIRRLRAEKSAMVMVNGLGM